MIALRPWAIPALLSRRRGVTWAQFFSGRVGAVWDPRLLTQMSTSRTGGTWGVSLSDTVGFVVDQARGGTAALGDDLLAGLGGFSSASGWNTPVSGAAITGGSLAFDGVTSIAGGLQITTPTSPISVLANRSYLVSYEITGGTTNAVSVGLTAGGVLGTARTAAGPYSEILTATSNASVQILTRTAAGIRTGSIDNLTVRELPGCHMIASSDARRATLVGYNGGSTPALYANGAHGYGSASTLDLSGSDEVTVIAQVRKLSDASQGVLAEVASTSEVANAGFAVIGPHSAASATYRARSSGTVLTSCTSGTTFAAPDSAILVLRSKISTDTLTLSRNGTQIATSASDQGTGNYGNHLVNWMLRNSASPSLFATAEFGPLAIIGGALSADDLATAVALAAY